MKTLLIPAMMTIAAALLVPTPVPAQTTAPGQTTLKMCVTLNAIITIVNPSQACGLGATTYYIQTAANPANTMTASISANGTIVNQSVSDAANGSTTPWITAASVSSPGVYSLSINQAAFGNPTKAPKCDTNLADQPFPTQDAHGNRLDLPAGAVPSLNAHESASIGSFTVFPIVLTSGFFVPVASGFTITCTG